VQFYGMIAAEIPRLLIFSLALASPGIAAQTY
jgi:hypothetical protein